MSALALLEPHEIKVRRLWLIGLIFLTFLAILDFSLSSLGILLGGYLLYHCAYRHPGTAFLTWNICTGIIALVTEFRAFVVPGNGLVEPGLEGTAKFTVCGILLIFLVFCGWWLKLCVDVRRINKRVRHKFLYDTFEYHQVPEKFAKVTTLNGLNELFAVIVSGKDSDFVKAANVLYKKKKKQLLAGT